MVPCPRDAVQQFWCAMLIAMVMSNAVVHGNMAIRHLLVGIWVVLLAGKLQLPTSTGWRKVIPCSTLQAHWNCLWCYRAVSCEGVASFWISWLGFYVSPRRIEGSSHDTGEGVCQVLSNTSPSHGSLKPIEVEAIQELFKAPPFGRTRREESKRCPHSNEQFF